MAYFNKIRDLEVGKIYEVYKDQKRKSLAHWHNSYFIPIYQISKSQFEMIVVNPVSGADVTTTKEMSTFVTKSVFKEAELSAGLARRILQGVFKDKP